MSNGSYERFGKLLAMLGKIVYDDRRHIESVCAVLQGLVFDKFEWPKSKDWNAIRHVASTNGAMATVLANLDLTDKSPLTQQIIAAFPQCFREEAPFGPIPLSCIRARAIALGKGDEGRYAIDDDEYYASKPQSFGVLNELNVSFQIFVTDPAGDQWNDIQRLPANIPADAKQGDIVQHGGLECVVVENNQNHGVHELTIVPAQYIDITC